MAGGVGSRFWPFSRESFPKQFHDVLGTGSSLLQQTVERFDKICLKENIFVVTNKKYADLVKEQLPFITDDQLLLEPVGKNTAPCIAYASYKIYKTNSEANIIVAPSDHVILKEKVFEEKIQDAISFSDNGALVTLGIKPTRPDTGYGYIQYEKSDSLAQKVKRFTEKPNLELAKVFIANGDYVWNAGIFIWKASSIVHAFQSLLPDLHKIFSNINYYSGDEQNEIDKVYPTATEISIDYGIMEKATNVHVVLSDIGWSDLGTWKSLYEIQDKDNDDNVLDGNIKTYNTKDCIIKSPKNKLVVTNNIKGLIIAEYENVLMVCKKSDEQRVKQFVTDLKNKGDKDYY